MITAFFFQEGIELAESFSASFYCVYLADLYKNFPHNNVFPLLFSEYTNDTEGAMKKVFQFLELGKLSCLHDIAYFFHGCL